LIPSSQVSKREIDQRFERGEVTFDDALSQDNAFAAIAAKCPQQRVSICKIDGHGRGRGHRGESALVDVA